MTQQSGPQILDRRQPATTFPRTGDNAPLVTEGTEGPTGDNTRRSTYRRIAAAPTDDNYLVLGYNGLTVMDMKSLNPLSLLEKLINEHGSAAIRGDQIALLRDQLIATTKRRSELEAENTNLHEETKVLSQRIEDLETRLKELDHLTFSEDHIRILEFLSTHNLAIDTDIANSTDLPILTVQHHIDELRENKCVSGDSCQHVADMAAGRRTPTRWSVEPRGRSVLFEHQQQ
ncbi:hypothetical protein [Allorhodopirellula heiligendammensis]|uniref:hypothetical protein n=1 Tax=Allorhodopirellula heiligendammensis TaxID=2714739 RepID=UPI0011B57290|nr:hypothetical protein [Allorhodopirellula heiligendammensis]